MKIFESRYWKIIIFLQKFTGIWVFYNDWKKYLSWFYLYFFIFSFMISMGIKLYLELGVNLDIVVENIVGEMYQLMVFFKVTVGIVARKKLKRICILIAHDWKTIIDENELKVMHKYTEYGRKMITFYSGFMIISVMFFVSLPILLIPLLNYIKPLENATRVKELPYKAEYGIDQHKYFYLLMGQAIFGGVGSISVFICIDLTFMMVVQHVVTLFAIVNSRLSEVAKISKEIKNCMNDFLKGNTKSYNSIIAAITLHQRTIRYVDLVEDCFSVPLFVISFVNMLMFSGGVAVVLIKLGGNPDEAIRFIGILIAGLIHFYYLMISGQKILNSSAEVFDACYACNWYNLSKNTKTLVNIMLIRSLRPCQLTGGKMFTICVNTYCNMLKTGYSMFTVLRR